MGEPRVVAYGSKGYLKVIIGRCKKWINMVVAMF